MEKSRHTIELSDARIEVKRPGWETTPQGMLIIYDVPHRSVVLFPAYEHKSLLNIVVEWKALQKALCIKEQYDPNKTLVDYVRPKTSDVITMKLVMLDTKLAYTMNSYAIETTSNKRLIPLVADNNNNNTQCEQDDKLIESLKGIIEVFACFDQLNTSTLNPSTN